MRLRRALAKRNVLVATAAAAELPRVPLAEALALALLYLDTEPERYGRAIVRVHGRLCAEARSITPADAQLALAALCALRGAGALAAAHALCELCVLYGLDDAARAVEEWLERRG